MNSQLSHKGLHLGIESANAASTVMILSAIARATAQEAETGEAALITLVPFQVQQLKEFAWMVENDIDDCTCDE